MHAATEGSAVACALQEEKVALADGEPGAVRTKKRSVQIARAARKVTALTTATNVVRARTPGTVSGAATALGAKRSEAGSGQVGSRVGGVSKEVGEEVGGGEVDGVSGSRRNRRSRGRRRRG